MPVAQRGPPSSAPGLRDPKGYSPEKVVTVPSFPSRLLVRAPAGHAPPREATGGPDSVRSDEQGRGRTTKGRDRPGAGMIFSRSEALLRTISRVRNTIRRLTRPIRRWNGRKPAAVILSYHRVAEPAGDIHGITVSPDRFEQHLNYIRETCRPISLLDLVSGLQRGSFPDRAAVVTFDDGYIDNLTQALPLLESAGVPATVFVASGYTGGAFGFWWEELKDMLLHCSNGPESLALRIDGAEHRWALGSRKDRRRAYDDMHNLLSSMRGAERSAVMERLAASMQYRRQMDDGRRPMTANEISRLNASDLIDIGCHTMSHTRLSRLSPQHQRDEISAARDRIEEIIGGPVRAHSHPFGDFDESTDRIVRELGFAAACTTVPCPIQADSDALRLPRFVIGNWSRGAFGRCMEDFFFGERPA